MNDNTSMTAGKTSEVWVGISACHSSLII